MPFARSSAGCGICSDTLTKKSVSGAVEDACSTSLIGPAISRSFASGGVVHVSTRRAGSGCMFGPKPTTPNIQPGSGYLYVVDSAPFAASPAPTGASLDSVPSFSELRLPDGAAVRFQLTYLTFAG